MTDQSYDDVELSPAERYAASRKRAEFDRSAVAAYQRTLSFELDDFQKEACQAVEDGKGVLVAAPTGAGKTVVGEFAAYQAIHEGVRLMYTTPIKALSNQKYNDFAKVWGAENVGILTGDVSINGDAPIVVMTTEVLRNMLYQDSRDLADVRFVVMDEVHYLADRFRGPVWEECMILLPERVQVISLSATVSNAEEFGAWLSELRGHTEVIVSEHRPVPLTQHIMVGRRMFDLTHPRDPLKVNPEVYQAIGGGAGRGRQPRRRPRTSRLDVVATLEEAGLLPAIVFVFSRAGCQQAVEELLAAGVVLTTRREADVIGEIVERTCMDLSAEDRAAVGYETFYHAATRGIAAHHAGLLPIFKECVEQLFVAGLIRVVYATETLALGINMPARSVVIEGLIKWDGSDHVMLTPGQYTQLTGRAGRRGIDIEGHAIVVYDPRINVDAIVGLASKRTYPLNSAFRPTYSMAVNLLSWLTVAQAEGILESSFAQFQVDRSVGGLARRIRKERQALQGYEKALDCDCAFVDYLTLRDRISALEKSTRKKNRALHKQLALDNLAVGDAIEYRFARRTHRAVVVDTRHSGAQGTVLTLVDSTGKLRTMTGHDFLQVPTTIGFLGSASGSWKTPKVRKQLAAKLGKISTRKGEAIVAKPRDEEVEDELAALRAVLTSHRAHHCPRRSDHERWAARWRDVRKSLRANETKLAEKTEGLGIAFRRICAYLIELGYLDEDFSLTAKGDMLRQVTAETDLLITEILSRGVLDELSAVDLAAAATMFVFVSRGEDVRDPLHLKGDLGRAIDQIRYVSEDLRQGEERHRIAPMRVVDDGLVTAMRDWARGLHLNRALQTSGITAGDFVRWTKQTADVLDHIVAAARAAGNEDLAERGKAARDLIYRGIVAWSTI
ncbi:ATP-dependent RNA helicase HelY [Bowdeniella nasicola]|uniref:ATP-dependent RNA helicase HelY n=1 Tax=Bowdeniella nasicola TaxID=208480 RepID=A0A1H4AP43_9ACTO|nr:DEAD/DEAH box helicase [Bowdeniella nasicola]SEA37492.1 ATP-dependent RNA helicase HelY [Bowdeniella nasicola]